MAINRPGVLILSEDAEDYLPLLAGLAQQGTDLTTATTVAAARAAWSGQPVVMGQPDLVAAAIGGLGDVRWVQSTWAGITPLLAQGRRDFLLTAVKDTFGPQMAEYVLGYLLAHELRLLQRHRYQQQRDSLLWQAPGLLVTAHMAADSRPPDIARIFIENYNRFVAGGQLQYRVDFERGY